MTLVWSMMRRGINGFGVVARADIRQLHRSRSMADKFDNQTFENYKKENGGCIFDVSLSVASLITLFVSVSVCLSFLVLLCTFGHLLSPKTQHRTVWVLTFSAAFRTSL